jgi:cell wall-associated NlpC family hydrolase
VGIYAGHGMMWHSPRSGKTVRLVKIWTSRWTAGRVIG